MKKMIAWNKGIPLSKEHKQKLSKIRIKSGIIPPLRNGILHTEETKRKMSLSAIGHKRNSGKKHSHETKRKIGKANQGERSHWWKGGITPINQKIRTNIEFRLWREAVFARDNWTCQKYKIRGSIKLHPHHIQNFAQYPELRFAIDNGIALSEKAHREFHKKYGRKNNTKEQLKEFLK